MELFAGLLFFTIFCFIAGLMAIRRSRTEAVDRVQGWLEEERLDPEQKKKASRNRRRNRRVKQGSGPLFKIMEKNRVRLLQADWNMAAEEWIALKFLFALALPIGTALVANLGMAAIVFLVALILPDGFLNMKRKARVKQFDDQLGDAIGVLSNSLKAGYSFLQAVSSVAREMPDPISLEFRRLLKELSLGMDSDQALRNLVERVPSEDLQLMITAIMIQKETGGNLSEILDNIASTIRERIQLGGEIRALTAQGRMTGIIVGSMPLFLMGILYMADPSYLMLLFTHPIGKMLMMMAVGNEILGIWFIRKIIKVEV